MGGSLAPLPHDPRVVADQSRQKDVPSIPTSLARKIHQYANAPLRDRSWRRERNSCSPTGCIAGCQPGSQKRYHQEGRRDAQGYEERWLAGREEKEKQSIDACMIHS